MEIQTNNIDLLYANVQKIGVCIFLPLEEKYYRANEIMLGVNQFIVQDPDDYLLRFSEDLGVRS
ncbi:MAG: hypothetical protein IT292_06435 [Deltaproteobacteria bacterium]|nr:hypothetical protein [Deltaproteobacteria bacterium]